MRPIVAGDELVSRTKLIVKCVPDAAPTEAMRALFASVGGLVDLKMIRNRGYGFAEYSTPDEAERARASFDGVPFHGKNLRVSYALLHPYPSSGAAAAADRNLYVTNVAASVTLDALNDVFRQCGPIASSRLSNGVAFVRYETRSQAEDAIARLDGANVAGSTISVRFATRREPPAPLPLSTTAAPVSRTTVYVHNVGELTDELALWQLFGPYGAIDSIKVIKDAETNKNRGFAFVNMRDYDEAAHAIRALDGYSINGLPLSVSFKTQKAK